MELLEFPNKETWESRYAWIDNEIENAIRGSHDVSDHAVALFMELQACYCIGAWVSVIVLSISVIDAHLRECEAMDANIGTAELLEKYYTGKDINWLRRLRNKYVHMNIDNPAMGLNFQYEKRAELEADATKAAKMVIHALTQNAGT